MSKHHQKQIESQLIEIVNSRANENQCGDCGSPYPTWASYTLGIFLCGRCASVHRRVLPSKLSLVKSLTLDHWTTDQVERLRRIGNKKAKSKWNSKREPFPYDEDDTTEIENYIRAKYIDKKFGDGMGYSDYDDDHRPLSRLRLGSMRLRGRLSSYREIPKLTHRKLTTFESSQFLRQALQINGMGFNDKDSVKEALILSNGDIDFALDILNEDSKVNPNQEELAPSLPKRPTTSASSNISGANGFPDTNPMASLAAQSTQTAPSNDWWSGQQGQMAQQPAQTGQPQIYQYTDPVTGRVSYIDSNGQEYLDPNDPQHQQLLMQQLNPQLVAQQTNKQQIMNLYNQPDNFSSNVATPVQQPQNGQQQYQQSQQFQPPQTQQFQQQQFQSQPTFQFQQPQQPQQFQQPGTPGLAQLSQQPTAMGFQQPYGQQYWQ